MSADNSFYGGRKGISFILKERYNSVDEMNAVFSTPETLDRVNYGEYVIIDTVTDNKDYYNEENGNIYKRGFEGAEFIAKVTGSSGANWSSTTKIEYTLSNSSTVTPTEGWSDTIEGITVTGNFLWTKMIFKDEGGHTYNYYSRTLKNIKIIPTYAFSNSTSDSSSIVDWYNSVAEAY